MSLFEKLYPIVEEIFNSSRGSHDMDHTLRVLNMAKHIAVLEWASFEVVELSALLHDIARSEQDNSNWLICHAERWAELASKILSDNWVEPELIEKINHCISTHRKKWWKIPVSLEAKVLFDADKLDSIWATWIWRAFQFSWEIWSRFHNSDIDVLKTEAYSREDTAYREYMLDLQYIGSKMMTKEWRRIAEWRHDFMVAFFERLNKEVLWEI